MIHYIIKNRRGSALLVALLVMGVLMAVSLILSSLIFREIRITNDVVHTGKAYYAAESGIELSLYQLNNNLPGWETEKDKPGGTPQYQALKIDDDYGVVGEYRVNNTCQSYPCFDEGYDTEGTPTEQYYAALDLNDSITIPLFVVEDDMEKAAKHFTVEFYAAFNLDDLNLSTNINNRKLFGWDILRWKLFGIYKGEGEDADPEGSFQTETISDFTAISSVQQSNLPPKVPDITPETEIDFGNIPEYPSWFGSVGCSDPNLGARETDSIDCDPYGRNSIENSKHIYESATSGGEPEDAQSDYESALVLGECDNTEAREVYVYGGDGELGENDEIANCYKIEKFLASHRLNYLVLTNLMNPAVFKTGDEVKKRILSRLYYRIEVYGGDRIVRDHATIQANGYSGDIKQSIEVQIKRGSYLPVFNFTLYSTYKKIPKDWEDPV